MFMRKTLHAKGVRAIGRGARALNLHSTVESGTTGTVGRDVTIFLDDLDIEFILAFLAGMPAYRQVFRALADVLDQREAMARMPSTPPVQAVAVALGSLQSSSVYKATVKREVTNAHHD